MSLDKGHYLNKRIDISGRRPITAPSKRAVIAAMSRSCLKLDIKLGAFEAVFAPDFLDPLDLQKATSPPYAICMAS